jgi:polyisoprenoid-binding protein YceI
MQKGRVLGIAGLSAITLLGGIAHAERYTIDPSHSTVGFKIRHLAISSVPGHFGDFSGSLEFDPQAVEKSRVEATIVTKSIDTANKKRDDHLKGADFFDEPNNPTITFKSTKVESVSEGVFKATGDLTMHGVTKPVTLAVEYTGGATDPWGNKRVGFSATTSLSRKDFGITWNKALDAGGVVLGDEVKVSLEIEGIQDSGDAKKAG